MTSKLRAPVPFLVAAALALVPGAAWAQSPASVPALSALPLALQVLLFLSFTAIAVGMFSSGYALYISLSAYASTDRERRAQAFIPALMPGSQGLYSFAIAFLMIQNLNGGTDPVKVILAGVLTGLPCLVSAFGQAKVAAACIRSINHGTMDVGQALIATGIPELYALAGLAVGFLMMT